MKHLTLIAAAIFTLASTARTEEKVDYKPALENYVKIVHATYEDSLNEARELKEVIAAFVSKPNEENLKAAKEKWIKSRQPYLQSEAFRFYGGPIDGEGGPEALINAWPMDESYIDYVEGAPNAGMINDAETYPEITPKVIVDLNEKAGETAISCGYHAIEFLLWGQDFNVDGPGNRPVTDYTTGKNADRRKAYLQACSALLVGHLEDLETAWAPGKKGNYRDSFVNADDPVLSMWSAAYGAKTLSGKELSGERLLVAWDTQEQEDEHSCFSDTTTQDAVYDAKGVQNLITGKYTRVDGSVIEGPGLFAVAKMHDEDLSKQISESMDTALERVKKIPAPFDQAIHGDDDGPSRKAIMNSVETLEDLSWLLGQLVNKVLGFREAPETSDDG